MAGSFREYVETADTRLEKRKLDALAEFAAGAGHELNNPLAVVVGRAQLLLTHSDDPETARSLGIILNQARRAHRILRDLMFVARPPAARCRLFRPADLLRASLRDYEAECAARGIRLAIDVDNALPEIAADPDAVRHLTEILLRNAIEATPSGGTVEVRWSLHGDELAGSVVDTGKGIGAGEAAHLFDPFYCGRQAGRGLGLGLARAARITELSGGNLSGRQLPGTVRISKFFCPSGAPSKKPQLKAALDFCGPITIAAFRRDAISRWTHGDVARRQRGRRIQSSS